MPGFSIDTPGPPGSHDPITIRIRLIEDAAPAADVTSLRARVVTARRAGEWQNVEGGLIVSVGGAAGARSGMEWGAGRTLEMPVSFRRPARFLNDGVPDFERDLALAGTTLFASTKSGLLVEVREHGSAVEEAAAPRTAPCAPPSATRVGTHDAVSAGIVTAVLMGTARGFPTRCDYGSRPPARITSSPSRAGTSPSWRR